ncbi:MAG: DUF3108 domain-containing protein [Geminicoccaceae bacterium]|nr:DUF3108 domain-containing protein [Geminicoccaceae bacterium]
MTDFTRRSAATGLGALLLPFVIGGRSAGAAAGSRQVLDYRMLVANVEIARFQIVSRVSGNEWIVRLSIRNTGVASWLAGNATTFMSSRIHVDGRGRAQPVRFEARYEKPDRTRETTLIYEAKGKLSAVEVRNNGKERTSDVPVDQQRGTVDPLTAYARVQLWLGASRSVGDEIVVPVFEGRKRGDLRVRYAAGTNRGERLLLASIQGLSGFDDGDVLVSMPGESPRWLEVRVSAGAEPMVLSVVDPHAPVPTLIEPAD